VPTIRVSGSNALSATVVIVQCGTLPAIFSGLAVVRSSVTSDQVSPRSSDLNSRLPPNHTVRGLCRESRIGEFQLKRYSSPSGARGWMPWLDQESTSRR